MQKTVRDSNNNKEEGAQDMSERVPEQKEPMDYEDHDDDFHGNDCDTNDTVDWTPAMI